MYPVGRIFKNITEDLKKYSSIDIVAAINNGLKSEVRIIDSNTGITHTPYIYEIKNEKDEILHEVVISAAFCQYIWIICNILLTYADFMIISKEIKDITSKKVFIEGLKSSLTLPDEMILQCMPSDHKNMSASQIKAQLKRMVKLLEKDDLEEDLDYQFHLASILKGKREETVDMDKYNDLDMEGNGYGELVNAICIKAISFIMLHEYNHHSLGHFESPDIDRKDKEREADMVTLIEMVRSCPDTEIQTLRFGVMSIMLVNLFYFPSLTQSDTHPAPYERLFYAYDYLQSREYSEKMDYMLIYSFNKWREEYKRSTAQDALNPYDKNSIEYIRNYFGSIK